MKNKILTALLFIAVLINMSIVPIYANESKRDAYNFDFSVCDDKTAIVKYNENTGRYESFGRTRYVCFKNMEFSEAAYFASMAVATGQAGINQVQICVDSINNPYATYSFEGKNWNENETQKIQLDRPISKGVHDIYVYMIAGYGNLGDLKFYPKVKRIEDFAPEKLYTDINDFNLRHKIVILTDLGIIGDYENGIFDEKLPVTNIEFFNAIYGLYEGVEDSTGKSENMNEYIFTELKNNRLIDYEFKDFKPDRYISDIEAVKMAIKVLGYEPLVNVKGGNDAAYWNVAKDLKLDKGIKNDGSLQRAEMVNLLYNTINANCMTITGFGQNGKVDYSAEKKILEKTRNIAYGEGIVELTPAGTLYAGTESAENVVSISGKTLRAGKSHAIAYIGRMCDYWYDEESEELIALDSQNEDLKIATYDGYQFDLITEERITYKDAKGTKKNIRLNSNVKFIYNGMALDKSFTAAGISEDTFSGQIIFVSNNGSKNYDVVLLEEYKNIKLAGLTDTGMKDSITGEEILFDENDSVSIYGKGDTSIPKEDLKYGDNLVVYASINTSGRKRIKIYADTSTVISEITNFDREDRTAFIDGKKYGVANSFLDRVTVSLQSEYILNTYGEIVDCQTPEETDWILGLLTKILSGTDDNGEDFVEVKIFAQDELKKYALEKRVKIDGRLKKEAEAADVAIRKAALNTPVRFKLNTNDKISVIDTVVQDAENGFDSMKKISKATSEYYFQGGLLIDKSLGRTICPFKGKVINYYTSSGKIYEDMYSFAELATRNYANGETPFAGDIYTTGENDDFPDVFVCRNNFYPYYYGAMLVSKKVTRYDDEIDDIFIELKGYDSTGKDLSYPVEMSLYNENYNNYKNIVDSISTGDIIYFRQREDKTPTNIELIFSNKDTTGAVAPSLNDNVHFKNKTLTQRFMWGTYDGMLDGFMRVKYQADDEWVNEYARTVDKVLQCDGKYISYITPEAIPIGSKICIVWIDSSVRLAVVYE